MQHALWLASVFGPLLVINGLWTLFYHENMNKVFTSVKNTPAVFHLCAMINLFLGLIILTQFNVWAMNLLVLVTLLGWCFIVRGLLALFVPQVFIKSVMGKVERWRTWGVIHFIWGILLCWLAFWM